MYTRDKFIKILKISIVPLTLIGFSTYMYFVEGLDNISNAFSTLQWKWLAVATAVYLFSIVLYDLNLAFTRWHYQKHFPFWYVMFNTRQAAFYEMITPGTFAFGPIVQVKNMSRQGIPPSKGAAIILVHQTCSVFANISFSLVLVFSNYFFFKDKMSIFMWIIFGIALCVSSCTILVYMLAPRMDKVIIKVAFFAINILDKLHLVRKSKKGKLLNKTKDQILKLKYNMSNLDYSFFEWVRGVIILFIEKFVLMSVQYFVALSLNIPVGNRLFLLVAAQSMINLISNQIPIPGNFGAQELAYYIFMLPIIGSETNVNFMILLNRFVTYYFPLLIGAIIQPVECPSVNKKVDIVDGFTRENTPSVTNNTSLNTTSCTINTN